jgi:hypothetical protein
MVQMGKSLEIDEVWFQRISSSLNGLEYGTVQIIVHDGRIVQIERTERSRYDQEAKSHHQESQPAKQVKQSSKRYP